LTTAGDASSIQAKQKNVREFEAPPWSLRVIFKTDPYKDTNYLEIKKLAPTITSEGVPETYTRVKPIRTLGGRPGCPLAHCSEVTFDETFGVGRCKDAEVTAVRVLVKIEEHTEGTDPDIAVPDPTGLGLRVCRKVSCAISPDMWEYFLAASGVVSAVQWLLTAAAGTVFYTTATVKQMKGGGLEFRTVARMNVAPVGNERFAAYMKDALTRTEGTIVEFTPTRLTPHGRKRAIDEAAATAGASLSGSFSKRRAL
jgi:hypothetical protein